MNKVIFKITIFLILTCSVALNPAISQAAQATDAGVWLRLPFDARSSSYAGFYAVADSIGAVYSNPAGFIVANHPKTERFQISGNHTISYLESKIDSVAANYIIGSSRRFAVGAYFSSFGDSSIDTYNTGGQKTGQAAVTSVLTGANFAAYFELLKGLGVSAGVKQLNVGLAGQSSNTLLADIDTYLSMFEVKSCTVNLAAGVNNYDKSKLSFSDNPDSLTKDNGSMAKATAGLSVINRYFSAGFQTDFPLQKSIEKLEIAKTSAGVEFTPIPMLRFRVGSGLTDSRIYYGFGFSFKAATLEFGYTSHPYLGQQTSVSIAFKI